ncbi:hypothetical protein [Streptomyces sp. NBC_00162]|uniref:hypothetical protein n=1 Tax=Streptomyces sp. NBC_00162 TaxID=2903629 RepID=UPI00214B97B9|nr:hypothetical protein [Streptomyces sp. NBC_00162]UUU44381.1 hypothetical protein JIW86_40040 [Streptomyces sp. NBC_00162]
MATTPHAGSSTRNCAEMKRLAQLSRKELAVERRKLSGLRQKHEKDPIKAQKLRDEIKAQESKIQDAESQLDILLGDIAAGCSG